MKALTQNKFVSAVLMVVLGILFLIWKGEVISVGMTVFGALLIIQAIVDVCNKEFVSCAIKALIGVVIIVFGWLLLEAALYILGAVMLIVGALQLIALLKNFSAIPNLAAKILGFFHPGVYVVIGVSLLCNQGETMSIVFIIAGIFMIVEGALALADGLVSLKKKND